MAGLAMGMPGVPLVMLLMPHRAYLVMGIPIAMVVISAVYLLLARRHTADPSAILPLPPREKGRLLVHLNIAFTVLFAYSLLVLLTRPELYTRPVAYFIATALAAAVLAAEVLFLPRNKTYDSLLLLKIVMVVFSVQWSQHLLFSGPLGIDATWHSRFTANLLASGQIDRSSSYAEFATMHLMFGSAQLLGNLDFKTAALLVMSAAQVSLLTFTYLLGRHLFSRPVGLLATLLLGLTPYYIEPALFFVPNVFALFFYPAVIYILMLRHSLSYATITIVLLVLFAALIFAHPLGAMAMGIILASIYLGCILSPRSGSERVLRLASNILVSLFFVGMLTKWMYLGEAFKYIPRTILQALEFERYLAPPSSSMASIRAVQLMSFGEYLMYFLGFLLYYSLAVLGILRLVSRRDWAKEFAWGLTAGLMLLFTVAAFALLRMAYPERWFWMSTVALALPAAVGLAFVLSPLKVNARRLALPVVAGGIIFLSITTPRSNYTTSIYSPNSLIRLATTESELTSVDTLRAMFPRSTVKVDRALIYPFAYAGPFEGSIGDLFPWLAWQDFTSFWVRAEYPHTLIVIRKMITRSAFYGRGGFAKIDYDPRELLEEQRFGRIFDSGTVAAFTPTVKYSREVEIEFLKGLLKVDPDWAREELRTLGVEGY